MNKAQGVFRYKWGSLQQPILYLPCLLSLSATFPKSHKTKNPKTLILMSHVIIIPFAVSALSSELAPPAILLSQAQILLHIFKRLNFFIFNLAAGLGT